MPGHRNQSHVLLFYRDELDSMCPYQFVQRSYPTRFQVTTRKFHKRASCRKPSYRGSTLKLSSSTDMIKSCDSSVCSRRCLIPTTQAQHCMDLIIGGRAATISSSDMNLSLLCGKRNTNMSSLGNRLLAPCLLTIPIWSDIGQSRDDLCSLAGSYKTMGLCSFYLPQLVPLSLRSTQMPREPRLLFAYQLQ